MPDATIQFDQRASVHDSSIVHGQGFTRFQVMRELKKIKVASLYVSKLGELSNYSSYKKQKQFWRTHCWGGLITSLYNVRGPNFLTQHHAKLCPNACMHVIGIARNT